MVGIRPIATSPIGCKAFDLDPLVPSSTSPLLMREAGAVAVCALSRRCANVKFRSLLIRSQRPAAPLPAAKKSVARKPELSSRSSLFMLCDNLSRLKARRSARMGHRRGFARRGGGGRRSSIAWRSPEWSAADGSGRRRIRTKRGEKISAGIGRKPLKSLKTGKEREGKRP